MERQYTPEKQKQMPKTNEANISVANASEKKVVEKVGEEKITEQKKEKIEKKEEEKIAGAPKEVKKTEEVSGKKKEKEKPKKTEAVVYGKDLGISTKHSIAICNFIRGKKAEEAVYLLEEVSKMKKAIPMKGEIPHRKGMMSGRYPVKAAKQFIKLLKQLAANATVNNLELEKARIECNANRASRPYKRGGSMRFKRTHVTLKLKEKEEKLKQEHMEKK